MNTIATAVLVLCAVIGHALCDTPANCTYEDIQGYWLFEESPRDGTRRENCDTVPTNRHRVYLRLDYPNVAIDKYNNIGEWTVIYNQGFEVNINYRKYFAFSAYTGTGNEAVSFCNETLPGWSHDVLGHNWACFKGAKVKSWPSNDDVTLQKYTSKPKTYVLNPLLFEIVDIASFLNEDFVSKINQNARSEWTATLYPEFKGKSTQDLIRMAGGVNSQIFK